MDDELDEPPEPEHVTTSIGERVRVVRFDFNIHTPKYMQELIDLRCNGDIFNVRAVGDLLFRLESFAGGFIYIKAERDGGEPYEPTGRVHSFFCLDDDSHPSHPQGILEKIQRQKGDEYEGIYLDRIVRASPFFR